MKLIYTFDECINTMCGILAVISRSTNGVKPWENYVRKTLLKLNHRGPDYSSVVIDPNGRFIVGHTRLAIVDPFSGQQPFQRDNIVLAVNGEIYNHQEIRQNYPGNYQTGSDCECIINLIRAHSPTFLQILNGVYAFVAIDNDSNKYIIARDRYGVVPLYTRVTESGDLVISSELKCLTDLISCHSIKEFQGIYVGELNKNISYATPTLYSTQFNYSDTAPDLGKLRELLIQAVRIRLMSDVPFGVLLSGGLDSSIIAAIVVKLSKTRIEASDHQPAWYPQIHSFAVGLDGSPDLHNSRIVADHIGTIHHEIIITPAQVLETVKQAIYHVESFDVATVRSAIPMYLMAGKIHSMGLKMVLGGDGSDEIFAGYEYFKYAPDSEQLHQECTRKLLSLHAYDCNRGNKSMAAKSVEYRLPFLDRDVVEYVMTGFHPRYKMFAQKNTPTIEKYILRHAFDGWLPEKILYRSKMQFSAGCGSDLIKSLIKHAPHQLEKDFLLRETLYPLKTPLTPEAMWYRQIFENHFGKSGIDCVQYEKSLNCSTVQALEWFPTDIRDNLDPCGLEFALKK